MERLVDRFLRDEILALQPLHPNQHAYQARKSVETALQQLVVRAEKAHDQQEIALGVFLDIEWAFDNTSYDYVLSVDQTWGRPNHRTMDYSHSGGSAGHGGSRGCLQECRGVQGLPSGGEVITPLMVPGCG